MAALPVASIFMEIWINMFGVPRNLLKDQQMQFIVPCFSREVLLFHSGRIDSYSVPAAVNGILKRLNKTETVRLYFYVAGNQRGWDIKVQQLTYGYNTAGLDLHL